QSDVTLSLFELTNSHESMQAATRATSALRRRITRQGSSIDVANFAATTGAALSSSAAMAAAEATFRGRGIAGFRTPTAAAAPFEATTTKGAAFRGSDIAKTNAGEEVAGANAARSGTFRGS
ncbi:unnamed protein product, partial [Phaeothamnion confervicola]